jgi:hypothetical protein
MKALRRIQREAQQKPEKWRVGQWVGLFQGKVIAASFDWKEVVASVESVVRDRQRVMLFRIGDNYNTVERVL